jgi:MoaA/NifB/PqqE/SkfB family radical SAM enzyme
VRRLAGELCRLGTREVMLSGGEPLLHPEWPEIARLLRAAGCRVIIVTNGLLLTRYVEPLVAKCDALVVSLDGATAATYAAIRGVDGLEAVLRGTRAVAERHPAVTFRATLQRANFRELPDLIRLARSLPVMGISFLAADVSTSAAFGREAACAGEHELLLPGPAVAAFDRGIALTEEELDEFARLLDRAESEFADLFAARFILDSPARLRALHGYFAALLGRAPFPPVRCNVSRYSVVIETDGRLRPCFFLPGYSESRELGEEVGTPDLLAVLNAPEARGMRRSIRAGERAECRRCVCSLYRSSASVLLGRA